MSPEDIMCAAAKAGHECCMAAANAQGATNYEEAMVDAAFHGHIDCADWAARYYTKTLNEAAENGHSEWGTSGFNRALNRAAMGGHVAGMKWAKQKGANHFEQAMAGAAQWGHMDCIDLAIEWGARDYDTALCWAAMSDNVSGIKRMISLGATPDAISDALRHCVGHWGVPNWDEDGYESISASAMECVRQLIAHGATVNLKGVVMSQLVTWVMKATCYEMFTALTGRMSTRAVHELWEFASSRKLDVVPAPFAEQAQRCLGLIIDRRVHATYLDACIALSPLGLPVYVVHWILEWIEPHGLSLVKRVRLLEAIRTSACKVRDVSSAE